MAEEAGIITITITLAITEEAIMEVITEDIMEDPVFINLPITEGDPDMAVTLPEKLRLQRVRLLQRVSLQRNPLRRQNK
jgi:hypothetical protein